MSKKNLPENFYERIKPQLQRRIGRELRLAGRILDLGCGSCELDRYLVDTYHQKVTGVDIVSANFPKHRRSRSGQRFHCICQDAAHLKSIRDGAVDAVVTMEALHEMKRPKAILVEANRVLRPGGKILVVDFPRGSLAQRLWDENYYSPTEIGRMLKQAGFVEVRVKTIERGQLMWGTGYRPCCESSRHKEMENRA